MKIGIDATCFFNKRGYGRFARSLFGAIFKVDKQNTYTLFVDSREIIEGIPEGIDVRYVPVSMPAAQAASATSRRSLGDLWRMSRAMSGAGMDALIFPTVYTYVPVITPARKVVFIHDAIPEVYPELTLPDFRARRFWQVKSALARRQADAIVTVSEYSRRKITELFHIPDQLVHVVGEASDPVFRLLDDPYQVEFPLDICIPAVGRLVVYLGGFGPHKNVSALVQAFSTLAGKPENADICLILVGEYHKEIFHSEISTLQQQINQAGLGKRAIFTGYLPDEQVAVLLNRATVLVLPSLMEGYGLPAVEAAACGCPVIATRESPLPELLGEGGLYFDPADISELSHALQLVLDSQEKRETMQKKGLEAAGKLSWEFSARQMIAILSSLEEQPVAG